MKFTENLLQVYCNNNMVNLREAAEALLPEAAAVILTTLGICKSTGS